MADTHLMPTNSLFASRASASLFHLKREREPFLPWEPFSCPPNMGGERAPEWLCEGSTSPISGEESLSSLVSEVGFCCCERFCCCSWFCCWETSNSNVSFSAINKPLDLQLVSGSLGKEGSTIVAGLLGTSGCSANPKTPDIVDNDCCSDCNCWRKAAHKSGGTVYGCATSWIEISDQML